MRALRYHRYGSPDVLEIDELQELSPAAGYANVRLAAAGLNPVDWKILEGRLRFVPLFRGPPRGVACDFAGTIVGVGGGATERHVGERVMGSLLPFGRDGACSEYIVVAYERLVSLPREIDDIQAAALPLAGGTALQALSDHAHLAAGQRVLVIGAAGGVGHFAVQIAKHRGAHVVAVCSATNVEFVRQLGADEVVDYTRDDFTQREDRFDVVFDTPCASSFSNAKRVLTGSGCYINTGADTASAISAAMSAVVARLTSRQRAIPVILKNGPPIWRRLLDLARKGVMHAHVRTISMNEVGDAFRAMVTGHGRGKQVVRLD